MCKEYNGWTNRETWATMLWINNDEGLQNYALELARQEHEGHDEGEEINAYDLGERVRDWIEEDLLTFQMVMANRELWIMLTDIGSLYRVDWREIAESLLADTKEGN